MSSLSSYPTLATAATATGHSLNKSTCKVFINNIKLNALIDSGSTNSFIYPRVVNSLSLSICPDESQVSMASAAFSRKVRGCGTDDKRAYLQTKV